MAPKREKPIVPRLEDNNDDTGNAATSSGSTEAAGEERQDVQGGFLFITSTGRRSSVKDTQRLKTLRSHVMHNYLGRVNADKDDNDKHHEEKSVDKQKSQPPSVGGQKMRFRLRSGEMELKFPSRSRKHRQGRGSRSLATSDENPDEAPQHVHPLAVAGPSSHRVDPFNSLAIEMDPIDEILLVRFRTIERRPWCPINGQGLWSSFALTDQLVFHATMYSWNMSFRNRRGVGLVIESTEPETELRILQHKGAAIKLINERLSNDDKATTDESVAAIAALTNIALIDASKEEATKHMQGLRLVTAMRGGITSFVGGIRNHLSRLISFNDMMYSELFNEGLKVPPLPLLEESWSQVEQSHIDEPLPGLGQTALRNGGITPHPIIEVLEDIRQLCHSEQSYPLLQADEKGRMIRGDSCHRLERRLRTMIWSMDESMEENMTNTVWRAAVIAALAYVHHYLRGNPLRYRHFTILSEQLHRTLLSMEEDLSEFDFAPALLIWILSTASIVGPVTRTREEFVVRLEKACFRFGLVSYDRYRWVLKGFLWVGEADEERYSELWQQVDSLLQARYLMTMDEF